MKVGDFFVESGVELYIIAKTGIHKAMLISLHSGHRWNTGALVNDETNISPEEFQFMSTGGSWTPAKVNLNNLDVPAEFEY